MFQTKKSKLAKALAVIGLMLLSTGLYTQVPPSGSGHGGTGNQEGGCTPVGGGIVILISLGAAYGGKRLNKAMHYGNEEMEE
jgi:hypothetical protein